MNIIKIFILFLTSIFAFKYVYVFASISSYEYILALERCLDKSVGNFTIHGLWPQYNSKTWPQYCNKSSHFDIESLDPIMNDINKYWNTCKQFNRTEKWFLSHEWLKHGTCTPFNEIEYFSTGLALYKIIPWKDICDLSATNCMLKVTGTSTSTLNII